MKLVSVKNLPRYRMTYWTDKADKRTAAEQAIATLRKAARK